MDIIIMIMLLIVMGNLGHTTVAIVMIVTYLVLKLIDW